MIDDLKIELCRISQRKPARLLGRDLDDWRLKTRRELGLSTQKPIVATGHQTLLWHPGILVKYLLVQAWSQVADVAMANLVVDQHTGDFGDLDVPLRRRDGSLAVRTLHLTRTRPDVPMALHEAFVPPPVPAGLLPAVPSVQQGLEQIYHAVGAHADAANAALQMAAALTDLMAPWVSPMTHVTASELIEGSLARALISHMADDPRRCAEAYNAAVARTVSTEGRGVGLRPLLVRDDYVELPMWRIRDDGRRMRAYDSDIDQRLMPRALFLTALVRLGMCDCFVHGTGGARYDRAMEDWIQRWLGLEVAPAAVATATVRLDLQPKAMIDVDEARRQARRWWHDPGSEKQPLLDAINAAPRGSQARQSAFLNMHRQLEQLRRKHQEAVDASQRRAALAVRQTAEVPLLDRRTWAFPLYPSREIDQLVEMVQARVVAAVEAS